MNSNNFLTTIHDRVAKSKFFTLSLVIHTVIVVIFGGIVIIKSQPPEIEFRRDGGYHLVEEQPAPKTDEPEPRIVQPELKRPTESMPNLKIDTAPVLITSNQPAMRTMPSVRIESPKLGISTADVTLASAAPGIGGEMGLRFQRNGSGHILMGGSRGNGPGPTKVTEEAVMRGLAWLQKVQNGDGSWGERNRGAMTGLALLCFLGHGEYGQSLQFGFTVNNAVEWIIKNGTASQSRLSMSREGWGSGNAGVYEHGIATYALGEYYTMTMLAGSPDERVVELLRGAVRHIIEGQGPDGG